LSRVSKNFARATKVAQKNMAAGARCFSNNNKNLRTTVQ